MAESDGGQAAPPAAANLLLMRTGRPAAGWRWRANWPRRVGASGFFLMQLTRIKFSLAIFASYFSSS
ncbi:MAG TPA: hypothetical protein VF800_15700 [Telluria sp.]|jgi:hypothetical protein